METPWRWTIGEALLSPGQIPLAGVLAARQPPGGRNWI